MLSGQEVVEFLKWAVDRGSVDESALAVIRAFCDEALAKAGE